MKTLLVLASLTGLLALGIFSALIPYASTYVSNTVSLYNVVVEPSSLTAWVLGCGALPLHVLGPVGGSAVAVTITTSSTRLMIDALAGGGSVTCTVGNAAGAALLAGDAVLFTIPWRGTPWAPAIDATIEATNIAIAHGAVLELLRKIAPWLIAARFEVSSEVVAAACAASREGRDVPRGVLLSFQAQLSFPLFGDGKVMYDAAMQLESGRLVVEAKHLAEEEVKAVAEEQERFLAEQRHIMMAALALARLFGLGDLEAQLKVALDDHDRAAGIIAAGEVDHDSRLPRFSVVWSPLNARYNATHVTVAGGSGDRLDIGLGLALGAGDDDRGYGSGPPSKEGARAGVRVAVWDAVGTADGTIQSMSVGIPLASIPRVPPELRNESLIVGLRDGVPDLSSVPGQVACLATRGWSRGVDGEEGAGGREVGDGNWLGSLVRAGARALVARASDAVCEHASLAAPPAPSLPDW